MWYASAVFPVPSGALLLKADDENAALARLAAADLVVTPLRIARGIQNKVLEAMAMARAVVATPAAFEGIEAEPGRDLIVAAGAEAMAAEIARLLGDKAAREALGAHARALVTQSYSWESRLSALDDMVMPAGRKAAA